MSRTKKIIVAWAAATTLVCALGWAMGNDHQTVAMWLFVPTLLALGLARMVRHGDAAFAAKCPYCRGKVKGKATACSKCGRVVRKSAVGA